MAYAFKLMGEHGIPLDEVGPRLVADLQYEPELAAQCVALLRAHQEIVDQRFKEMQENEAQAPFIRAGTIGSIIGALLGGGYYWLKLMERDSTGPGAMVKYAGAGAMIGGFLAYWIARARSGGTESNAKDRPVNPSS
jgi:DNA-binding transcriptional MerR regulator